MVNSQKRALLQVSITRRVSETALSNRICATLSSGSNMLAALTGFPK